MTRLIHSILLAVLLLTSASQANDVQWRVLRTQRFLIHYAAGHEAAAERAGEIAEEWHAKISKKLDFYPKSITPIYLYPDRGSFAEAIGIAPGDRVVGIAQARTLKVRVDASGGYTDIAAVIPHELVHVFVSMRLKGHSPRLPLWMHEGLAKYLAEDWSQADAELLADVAGSELMPLERISKVFPTDARGRAIAYVQSYSAVKYMADKFTPEAIHDLLAELEAGHPFKTALFYSIGQEPAEFEADWRRHLWEEYTVHRWWKLGAGLISGAMGFLAILAFRARVRQKRRKAEELSEEEVWDRIIRGNPP